MHQEVINFWFKEIEPSQWWVKDSSFDELIRSRFLNLHHQAIACELFSWRETSLGRLAEIITLDQFSRNIYRDTPLSFAYDSLALALSQSAITAGCDKDLNAQQRMFLYMPFMHSESLAIHAEAEVLFEQLGIESTLEFEKKHKVIIEQFGRYPHRNNILGRASSAEEIEFLKRPDSGF